MHIQEQATYVTKKTVDRLITFTKARTGYRHRRGLWPFYCPPLFRAKSRASIQVCSSKTEK
jgi:NADH:ubiquinone oxidoreductase subunit E